MKQAYKFDKIIFGSISRKIKIINVKFDFIMSYSKYNSSIRRVSLIVLVAGVLAASISLIHLC